MPTNKAINMKELSTKMKKFENRLKNLTKSNNVEVGIDRDMKGFFKVTKLPKNKLIAVSKIMYGNLNSLLIKKEFKVDESRNIISGKFYIGRLR